MSRSRSVVAPEAEARRDCRGCGTSIPLTETILVKFQRCYYCGQHHPFGHAWMNRTAPAVIIAAIGLIALWWTQGAS